MSKWDEHGQEFLRLRAEGRSYAKIAGILPVSVTTCKKWGLKWQPKIEEMRAAHVSGFLKGHLMELEHRLKLRAEQISRLRDELADRDLGELSTQELLRLELRYLDAAQKEVAPLKVEVSNPLATYENILVQCLRLPEGTTMDDVPKLAAELAGETRKQLPDESEEDRERWRLSFEGEPEKES